MRAIKGLVIGMGALILVGFVVVAVTLVMRMQGSRGPEGAPFQNVVQLPAGAKVVETVFSDDKIILRLRTADGAESLVLINSRDGRETGRIALAVSQ